MNNGWQKKDIPRMDMMHILGLVYVETCAGYGRIGLCRFVRKHGIPSVKTKYTFIARAMIKSRLLLPDDWKGIAVKYKWNMGKYGPVSIPIADMMMAETENQIRVAARSRYRNRVERMKKANEQK
jgi:hypothetical protein